MQRGHSIGIQLLIIVRVAIITTDRKLLIVIEYINKPEALLTPGRFTAAGLHNIGLLMNRPMITARLRSTAVRWIEAQRWQAILEEKRKTE